MRTKDVSIDEIIGDPCWFLEDLSTRDGAFSFARTNEDELSALPFLAQNWDRSALQKIRLDARTVLARLRGPAVLPTPNFIWHTAFCCSTLLSRALQHPGRNTALREPQVLLILAELKRYNYFANGRLDPRLMDAAFRLLSRPFAPGGRVLLKPAHAASYLVPDAARRTNGRMLFLYSDCRSFLISIIRRGEAGMRFARRNFGIIAGDGNEQFNWPMSAVMQLSDLRIAALTWHMQIAEFRRNLPALAEGRAASLDCDAFLDDPTGVLARLNGFFGLELGAAQLCQTLSGGLLGQDAKAPGEPYNALQRREHYRQIADAWAKDLDETVAWSYEVCPKTPRGMPLPNAIATVEKLYHP